MTNPTQPLTDEDFITHSEYKSICILREKLIKANKYLHHHNALLAFEDCYPAIKAAAQQTAQLVTKCEKLEAENERLKQQLEWQPIETAPKDGTPILVLGTHKYSNSMCAEIAMYKVGEWHIAWAQADRLICNAIKWKPIDKPQPPKEAT